MLSSLLTSLPFFPRSKVVDLPRTECIFCRIVDGIHRDSQGVIFEDHRLVVFPDCAPSSAAHYQVVSKEHILNVDSLRQDHHDLVEAMLQAGRDVCSQLHPGAPTKFGFHVPPFNSVSHLHMHAMVLPHKPWWSGCKYATGATWWLPADTLVERLRPPPPL